MGWIEPAFWVGGFLVMVERDMMTFIGCECSRQDIVKNGIHFAHQPTSLSKCSDRLRDAKKLRNPPRWL